jgi:Kef-type K+ transport system membrane component KefB
MTQTELFLAAMLVIFVVPYGAWRLLGGIPRLQQAVPLAIVQIVGGVVLGPGVLGAAAPAFHAALFTPGTTQMLASVAMWAVMLFVFLAGVELDLAMAWEKRRETGITAGFALVVPLAFGAAVALILQNVGVIWRGPQAENWQAILGIGMACAVTALPILVLLLDELRILEQPLGQRVLRYASLDDVAIWAVLSAILLDWHRLGRQAIFIAGFAIIAWALRKFILRLEERDRWFVALVWLLAAALAADWCGLHYMVGAFLAGAVMDSQWFDRQRFLQFRNTVLVALMPVFFLSTGLRTSWDMGGVATLAVAAALLAAAIGGKLVGVHIAGRLLGWARDESWIIGWLLQTKALIMIIFVNILLDRALISSEAFTALLLMAVASTVLTVPVVRPRLVAAHSGTDPRDLQR